MSSHIVIISHRFSSGRIQYETVDLDKSPSFSVWRCLDSFEDDAPVNDYWRKKKDFIDTKIPIKSSSYLSYEEKTKYKKDHIVDSVLTPKNQIVDNKTENTEPKSSNSIGSSFYFRKNASNNEKEFPRIKQMDVPSAQKKKQIFTLASRSVNEPQSQQILDAKKPEMDTSSKKTEKTTQLTPKPENPKDPAKEDQTPKTPKILLKLDKKPNDLAKQDISKESQARASQKYMISLNKSETNHDNPAKALVPTTKTPNTNQISSNPMNCALVIKPQQNNKKEMLLKNPNLNPNPTTPNDYALSNEKIPHKSIPQPTTPKSASFDTSLNSKSLSTSNPPEKSPASALIDPEKLLSYHTLYELYLNNSDAICASPEIQTSEEIKLDYSPCIIEGSTRGLKITAPNMTDVVYLPMIVLEKEVPNAVYDYLSNKDIHNISAMLADQE